MYSRLQVVSDKDMYSTYTQYVMIRVDQLLLLAGCIVYRYIGLFFIPDTGRLIWLKIPVPNNRNSIPRHYSLLKYRYFVNFIPDTVSVNLAKNTGYWFRITRN